MKIVFDASNSLEAHIVRGVLNMYEIEAYIQGEYLHGGAGELPMTGFVKISTSDDDYMRAKDLISDWQANKLMPAEWKEKESETTANDSESGLVLAF